MSLEYEVTPPRFFARVRRVPWAAPTSAEYFCAERVALWRKNGRSKCSREIWVTELRTRRQGGLARFNDTSGLASFAESPSIKFHPYGYLSSLRRPSTTTASSSRPRLLRWNEDRHRSDSRKWRNRSFLHRREEISIRGNISKGISVRDDDLLTLFNNHSFVRRMGWHLEEIHLGRS